MKCLLGLRSVRASLRQQSPDKPFASRLTIFTVRTLFQKRRARVQNVCVKMELSPRPQRTFAERFCEKFTCDPNSFESHALLASLDPLPRLFARLISTFNPSA